MSQPIRPLTHLRHVGLGVPDLAVAREFYTNLWGLEIVEEDSGIVFLASPASPENYIIRLRESANKRLDLVSFAGLDAAAVDALAARLGTAGVQIDREPATLDTPGGGYGFRFFDIDGRLVEVSADVAQKPYRELEPGEPIPQKLSHVVFNSTDVLATKGFYEQHLGFTLSDWLADIMCFLRTSPQHHSIAISHGPHTALNHISFEMRGLDEFMRGSGRLLRAGREMLWGPGRHGAGDNTFTYWFDEHGNVVEYTTELETVENEATWEVRTFETTPESQDQWGTGGLVTERMIPAMFNEPDRELWTPSPV